MKAFLRDWGVPAALLVIKFLTALRTGWDTYLVSQNWLNVILIDGVFLALWLYVAYGGRGKQANRNRPFAIAGTGGLYLWMVAIGWEADPGPVAIAVRVAGAVALLHDVWDYLAGALAGWQASRQKRRAERNRLEAVYDRYMTSMMRKALQAARKSLQEQVTDAVQEQLEQMLPLYVQARTLHTVNVVEGSAVNAANARGPSADVSDTVVDAWANVRGRLEPGASFTRADVEAWTGYGKTRASQVVKYGREMGSVQQAGRGEYVYSANGHRQAEPQP